MERFKDLLMKCPQHYLNSMQEIILFYQGLDVPTRQILDAKGAVPQMSASMQGKLFKKLLITLKSGTMVPLLDQRAALILTGLLQFKLNWIKLVER